MMSRDDAIARYGVTYSFSLHDRTIRESLAAVERYDGTKPPKGAADELLERAYNDGEAALTKKNAERIAQIDSMFATARNKTVMFLAGINWYKNSDRIKENVRKLREERAKLAGDIQNGVRGLIAVERLPDQIRIPAELPVGMPVFIVKTGYMKEGIALIDAKITRRTMHANSFGSGNFDFKFDYTATDADGKTHNFKYDHADFSAPEGETSYYGQKIFIDRKAAGDYTMAMIDRLRHHFDAVAGAIKSGKPAPRMTDDLDNLPRPAP